MADSPLILMPLSDSPSLEKTQDKPKTSHLSRLANLHAFCDISNRHKHLSSEQIDNLIGIIIIDDIGILYQVSNVSDCRSHKQFSSEQVDYSLGILDEARVGQVTKVTSTI